MEKFRSCIWRAGLFCAALLGAQAFLLGSFLGEGSGDRVFAAFVESEDGFGAGMESRPAEQPAEVAAPALDARQPLLQESQSQPQESRPQPQQSQPQPRESKSRPKSVQSKSQGKQVQGDPSQYENGNAGLETDGLKEENGIAETGFCSKSHEKRLLREEKENRRRSEKQTGNSWSVPDPTRESESGQIKETAPATRDTQSLQDEGEITCQETEIPKAYDVYAYGDGEDALTVGEDPISESDVATELDAAAGLEQTSGLDATATADQTGRIRAILMSGGLLLFAGALVRKLLLFRKK